jgi:hypothetical protein
LRYTGIKTADKYAHPISTSVIKNETKIPGRGAGKGVSNQAPLLIQPKTVFTFQDGPGVQ